MNVPKINYSALNPHAVTSYSLRGNVQFTHDHSMKCTGQCKGDGDVLYYEEAYDYRQYGSRSVSTYKRCPDCNGTGLLTEKTYHALPVTIRTID